MLICILVSRISCSFFAIKQIIVLICVDHKFDQLLALSFCQPPSKSLQRGADSNLFRRLDQVVLNLTVIQRHQLLLHLHELLGWVYWIQWWQRHLLHALEAFTAQPVDSLHSWRWHHALHRVEPILKLLLDRLDFLLKRVISAGKRMNPDHLLRQLHLRLHHASAHLLLIVLNKRWFHHVNAVLALNFVAIVEQEGLVA